MQVEQAYFKPLIYILIAGGFQCVCLCLCASVCECVGDEELFFVQILSVFFFKDDKIIIIFICKRVVVETKDTKQSIKHYSDSYNYTFGVAKKSYQC